MNPKHFYLIVCAVFSLSAKLATAQISEYYNPAIGQSGDVLKAALYDIIDDHQVYQFESDTTDVLDILKLTDRDPNNPENVILLYTGQSVNAAQEFNNGEGWVVEQIWPPSRGGVFTGSAAGNDVFQLRPAEISIDEVRDYHVYADCVNCGEVLDDDGQVTECFVDNVVFGAWSFEPRDAVKGDIARMLFYMAVRYEGDDGSFMDLELVDEYLLFSDNSGRMGVLSNLLAWNALDPVDDFEMNRNEVTFGFQGNRNPFVDHPELAYHIWGDLQGQPWPLSVGTTASAKVERPVAYPNPTSGSFSLSGDCKAGWISDISGREVMRLPQNQTEIDVQHLPSGLYLIHTAHCPDGGSAVVRLHKL